MVSFMYLGKYGRLANQLFEIATTISVAKNYNTEFCFNDWKYNKYLKNKIPCKRNESFLNYNESCFHYKPIVINSDKNWDLRGYFQSYKYFEKYESDIIEQFRLDDKYKNYILNKYDLDNSCSIHVRRGDFLQLTRYHNVLDIDYYKRAIEMFGGDMNFIVCSDDIEWCKENFDFGHNFTFITGEEDIIDLFILSMCKNNIMSNSSFSWWGSWLNRNIDKKVICSDTWFGPLYSIHDTSDLIPDDWIKISDT